MLCTLFFIFACQAGCHRVGVATDHFVLEAGQENSTANCNPDEQTLTHAELWAHTVRKKSAWRGEWRERCLRLRGTVVEFYGGYENASKTSSQKIELMHCRVQPSVSPESDSATCFDVELLGAETIHLCTSHSLWMQWFVDGCWGPARVWPNSGFDVDHLKVIKDEFDSGGGDLLNGEDPRGSYGRPFFVKTLNENVAIKVFKNANDFDSEVNGHRAVESSFSNAETPFLAPLGSFTTMQDTLALVYPLGVVHLTSWLQRKCKPSNDVTQEIITSVKKELEGIDADVKSWFLDETRNAGQLKVEYKGEEEEEDERTFGDCDVFVRHAMMLYKRLDDHGILDIDAFPPSVVIGSFGQRLIDPRHVKPKNTLSESHARKWFSGGVYLVARFLNFAQKYYLHQLEDPHEKST